MRPCLAGQFKQPFGLPRTFVTVMSDFCGPQENVARRARSGAPRVAQKYFVPIFLSDTLCQAKIATEGTTLSSKLLPKEIFTVRDGTRDDHYIGHENAGGHAKVGERVTAGVYVLKSIVEITAEPVALPLV